MAGRNGQVLPTTIIQSHLLDQICGARIVLVSETFQRTGSFKFRAAYQLVSQVQAEEIIAASSGNFGQALAYACSLFGKRCTVVMPENSARVKIEAVRAYGAVVDLIDTTRISRSDRVRQLMAEAPAAYLASAYDDDHVIAGNATLGSELAALDFPWDAIVAPVGGGGLTAGILVGLRRERRPISLIGAEPLLANDAARSLQEGRIVTNAQEPGTLADGARTLSLGTRNFALLKDGLETIVEVPEASIGEAVRLLFLKANLKAEPTGALGLAAILARPDLFEGKTVCCVVSGGNADPAAFFQIIQGA